jgi:hypothetical protein
MKFKQKVGIIIERAIMARNYFRTVRCKMRELLRFTERCYFTPIGFSMILHVN